MVDTQGATNYSLLCCATCVRATCVRYSVGQYNSRSNEAAMQAMPVDSATHVNKKKRGNAIAPSLFLMRLLFLASSLC